MSVEAADVGQPDERFDAKRGADREHELMQLVLRYALAERCQRVRDPADRSPLTQRKGPGARGRRFER
ncbi:MAG: hypothetical protein ACRDLS_10330 [Solirubrobacteraceae bacterium]